MIKREDLINSMIESNIMTVVKGKNGELEVWSTDASVNSVKFDDVDIIYRNNNARYNCTAKEFDKSSAERYVDEIINELEELGVDVYYDK